MTEMENQNEGFLLDKVHCSLVLKDESIIEPYLADDLVIIGAWPYTVIGDTHKERFINLLSVIEGGGSYYFFESSFVEINVETKIKNALAVEYHIKDECWAKLDVYIDCTDGLISKLFMMIKECDDYFWGVEGPSPSPLPQEELIQKFFKRFCANPGNDG